MELISAYADAMHRLFYVRMLSATSGLCNSAPQTQPKKKAHQTVGQTARTRTHFNSALDNTPRILVKFIYIKLLIFNLTTFNK